MWLKKTTSGQQQNNVEITNDSIADNPLLWMYSLVYGMSLIAILLFSIARSVLLMKVYTRPHYCWSFSTEVLIFYTAQRPPVKINVLHRFSRRVYSIIPLNILFHRSPIFTGVKECEIWPRSSTPLFFEPPSIRNEATHRDRNKPYDGAMTVLCSLQVLCSLADPLLGVEFESLPPLEKNC